MWETINVVLRDLKKKKKKQKGGGGEWVEVSGRRFSVSARRTAAVAVLPEAVRGWGVSESGLRVRSRSQW